MYLNPEGLKDHCKLSDHCMIHKNGQGCFIRHQKDVAKVCDEYKRLKQQQPALAATAEEEEN